MSSTERPESKGLPEIAMRKREIGIKMNLRAKEWKLLT